MSSFIALMTSLCNTTESKAQPLCARVTSCLIAVRKPWGLKKPVIQKTLGRPLKIHVENWLFLSRNSVNQKPRVDDSHEIWRKKKRQIVSAITELIILANEPAVQWHRIHEIVQSDFNRSDEGLMLETSAFLPFTVANLRFQPSC